MKKFKPILALLSTLIVGFFLGFLVSGQMTKKKMDDFLRWGTEEGFKEIMIEDLQPSEDQKKDLDPILEKYAIMNGELHNEWKKQHGELMRAMSEEMKPYLTQEQIDNWTGHKED